MPHAKVGVQNDPIHAIVAAVQQILIESAKSIAHARYATSTPLSFKLPRRGHFFEARSAKKRRYLLMVLGLYFGLTDFCNASRKSLMSFEVTLAASSCPTNS